MDIGKLFMKIKSVDDYVDVTKNVIRTFKKSKLQLNMTTVLSLKKARYFEIQYFNKFNEHGAAFVIIERLLEVARSKTWGLLGKELVGLLQHWLDATRKQLIIMNSDWWSFMTFLLKIVKELRLKDPALPDLLVESTAEPLLDLATRSELDVLQQLEILYCLNLCCADSSREVRFATRHLVENYFVKLSSLLAKTGHVPTQYYMLETLLRWLLPRQNSCVRRAAAAKWFPDGLYSREAADIFLERPWLNFFQDARDFLNAQNKTHGPATSAVYHQMTIGALTMECSPKRDSWLDINPATSSITVMLDPRMMEALGLAAANMQTLIVKEDGVLSAKLAKETSDITLSIKTSQPLLVHPSGESVGDGGDVQLVVSKRNDLNRFDTALREIFGDKYEVLIDFEELTTSPRDLNKKIISSSEEDTRFSHPVRPARRKASGYVIKSASTLKSPSTTSTTSLALLHDRLEALPKFKYNKDPLKVAALPDLSIVSEITEINDSQSVVSTTSSYRSYGIGYKNLRKSDKKSQSDGEKYKSSKKYISPIVEVKEHNPSCLLVATVGTNESVINDTIESLSKNKDYEADNIVDLLLKEALKNKDDKLDSGINTGENKKSQDLRESDTIDNTPNVDDNKLANDKKLNICKDDTSEEPNEIVETQYEYVSVRKKILIDKHKAIEEDIQKGIDANEMHTFDEEAVEKFFSEHIAENTSGGIVVSPSLARKINESSSEASDHFQDCLVENDFPNVQDIQDVEIIDCLNNIIDKVCQDFEKCAEILEGGYTETDVIKHMDTKKDKENIPSDDLNIIENKIDIETPKKKSKQRKVIKLKFKTKKTINKTRSQIQSKLDLPRKMSPILENKDSIEPENIQNKNRVSQIIASKNNKTEKSHLDENIPVEAAHAHPKKNVLTSPEINNISPKSSDLNTPLIRRRRKLYSPKDEHVKNDKAKNQVLEVTNLQEDDGAVFKSKYKKSPYEATCYKDIEQARKKNIRLPRSKKSKPKGRNRSPSPRTKKMNELFDNLKTNVEQHDDIILADKKLVERELAIYNFTSDSEDEDFKKKKVEIKKRISSTTNASGDSTVSRHGRLINKVNYSEKSSDEALKKTKKKNVVRRKKVRQPRPHNLADQKMREAQQEDLDTSLVLKNETEIVKEPDPILKAPAVMEVIGSEMDDSVKVESRLKKNAKKKPKMGTTKKEMSKLDEKRDNDDRTLSPLPGLIIEKVPPRKDDPNDSVSIQVFDKLKKIYQGTSDIIDESNTTQNLLLDMDKVDFNISNGVDRMSPDISQIIVNNTKDVEPTPRRNNAILFDADDIIEVCNFDENERQDDSKKNDKVSISISDVPSEKSIATVGKSPITAHGNINEKPPDNGQLKKRVRSRNLDIEDMELDTSITDYYIKLREEINKPINSSTSSSGKLDMMKNWTENASRTSPVVQVQKSTHDVSKILAVKESSETKIEKISANRSQKPVSPVVVLNRYDISKSSPNSSRKCISPVVSLSKMSYDDISKWLPSRRSSYDSSARSSEKSRIDDKNKDMNEALENSVFLRPKSNVQVKETKSRDNLSDLNSINKISEEDKSSEKTKKHITEAKESGGKCIKLHYNLRSAPKSISSIKRVDLNLDCNKSNHNSTTYRKSSISPIKIFDDLLKDYNVPAVEKDIKKHNEQIEIKSPVLKTPKKLRKSALSISYGSNISSSTRVDGKTSRGTFKRKSESPVRGYGKKRTVVLTESGPSASSIDEWFRKSAPVSAAKSLSESYGDSLQNILERLDTTLAEIHQTTNNNFVHLFVEAQRHLSEVKSERRRALKLVAGEVLKEVVEVMDKKFADLEKRNQEMDSEFMEQLKSRATEFIRQDCKKKRVMVALLQEDIRAVANQTRGQSGH